MSIYDEFKEYLKSGEYEIDEISETSLRGIKKGLKVHLFLDSNDEEYILNVNNDGDNLYNTIFIECENGYRLNHTGDKRNLKDLEEIINYTNSNIKIKI